MSSSKIIRKGGEPQRPYTLEPLGGGFPAQEQDVFRAVTLGNAGLQEVEAVEEEPVAPPCIPEEEALSRIRQAHADGLQQGREQARAELSALTEALAQALLATGSLRAQLMHEAEEDLLKLSVLIARKVMLREFACDPGIMAGLVQGALELASDVGDIVVRLNADEYQVLADCREFRDLLSERRGVTLKGDPAVARAGCLVETVRGNIDAGLDAQLDDILRRLTEEKSSRREEPGND
ncbi:MAG: flagellar assembly protein FliH [Geobacteraceae bacterium GWC2_58_44]|nr:MAG: flagellar assembly protein FliH [Geobacteraceae bacterium GWC2_58_44]HBG04979.1 flagellar assembly protein FliH [Geobacter sp.]